MRDDILTWLTAAKVSHLDRKLYCCYSHAAGQTVYVEVKNILKFIEITSPLESCQMERKEKQS